MCNEPNKDFLSHKLKTSNCIINCHIPGLDAKFREPFVYWFKKKMHFKVRFDGERESSAPPLLHFNLHSIFEEPLTPLCLALIKMLQLSGMLPCWVIKTLSKRLYRRNLLWQCMSLFGRVQTCRDTHPMIWSRGTLLFFYKLINHFYALLISNHRRFQYCQNSACLHLFSTIGLDSRECLWEGRE